MHVFSFPLLVATSVSFPLPLHFLGSFAIAYRSAADRILFSLAQNENGLPKWEGKLGGRERSSG